MKPDRLQARRAIVDAIRNVASRSSERLEIPPEDLGDETVLRGLGLDGGDLRIVVAETENYLHVRVDDRQPVWTNQLTLGSLVAHFTDQEHRHIPVGGFTG